MRYNVAMELEEPSTAGDVTTSNQRSDEAADPASRWILVVPVALVALAAAAALAMVRVQDPSTADDTASTTPTTAPDRAWRPPVTESSPRVSGRAPSGLRVIDGPPLSKPAPLPSDPYAPTPPEQVGTIEIPAIGVHDEINVGMTLTAIDRGPSWWPGTAEPGGVGTTVIAGHRTTHSRPFGDLDRLVPGDHVLLTTEDGRFTYAVSSVDVIDPHDTSIADQRWEHEAVLFACHPKGSARFRIVARLVLLADDGAPLDDQIEWRFDPPTFTDPLVALDAFGDEVLGSTDANLTVININNRRYELAGPPPDESMAWVATPTTAPPLDHLGDGATER